MTNTQQRCARAQEEMRKQGIDLLFVSPSSDAVYLTQRRGVLSERFNCFVLPATGDPVMVMPGFESLDLRREAAMDLRTWQDGEDPHALVAALVPAQARTIAVSDQMWSTHLLRLQARLPKAQFVSAARILTPLRQVKDAGEIATLQRAGAAVDAVFADILTMPMRGQTEREIARRIGVSLVAHGHQQVSFVIAGSGPNSASPHHSVSDRVLQDGDSVVFDYGGTFDDYASDITRTIYLGAPPEEYCRVYDTVRQAQEAAFQAARPGAACQDIDRAARRVIADAGYGDYFIHRTGHGLGIDGHEEPYMVEGNALALAPGMVFSIEPGIYIPGRFGVRIEDIVVITSTGAARFNHAPRDLKSPS